MTARTKTQATDFWSLNQPGFRFVDSDRGTDAFFADVERHRYALEPHIPEIVQFERWRDKDVLEVGCGIATDGVQFARAGARYVGIDASPVALDLAQTRFAQEQVTGRFTQTAATELPFDDDSFDLVFSHGVIHHFPATRQAVEEIHRVLKPGGTALVMVYHRSSLNYHFNIMVLRRMLAATLLIPGMSAAIARVTGERPEVFAGHRELLRLHGLGYLRDRELFLTQNTDGPGNTLSKVYTRADVRALFDGFSSVQTAVRFLNLRIIPGGDRLARLPVARWLERRIGWHLYVLATKAP